MIPIRRPHGSGVATSVPALLRECLRPLTIGALRVHLTSGDPGLATACSQCCPAASRGSRLSCRNAATNILLWRRRTRFFPWTISVSGSGFRLDAQSAHRLDRSINLCPEKAAQCAYAIGQGGNDNGAMRNAFIARYGDFDIDSRGAFDP